MSGVGLRTPQALDRLLTDALRRQEVADALLAIAAKVDLIVSGDNDMLSLGRFEVQSTIAPAGAIGLIEATGKA